MTDTHDATAFLTAVGRGMYTAYYAARVPDATALIGAQGRLNFRELNARCNQLARALRERGMRAGDGLAMLCHNSFEFVQTVMATRRIGVRLTPINFHLGADEVGYILRDCDAKGFVAAERFSAVAREAARDAPALQWRMSADATIEGFEPLQEAAASHSGDDIDDAVLGVNMLYTSGTTGRPKGVERPSAPALSAVAAATSGEYVPGVSLHLCTGPLYHAAPLGYSLVVPLLAGSGIVLMDGWDAERALQLIEQHRVSHTHMVPTMFHRLLALPSDVRQRYDVSSLRFVLHGAAPCPVPLKQALIEWLGPVVVEYYGATEGVGTVVDSASWLRKRGTVGKPDPADQIRVLDDEGRDVPAGVEGEIYLKAQPSVRFRYYKDEDKTQAAYRGDYFTLHDIGYLDEDGYLFLTDRSANLIISGGVNIYPAEVDAVLLTHPAVLDAGVIGVPNPEWGEEVKAVVELRPDHAASPQLAQALIEYCRNRLAHYKCPRSVDFVASLPRFDNGKLYKHKLREAYRRAAGR